MEPGKLDKLEKRRRKQTPETVAVVVGKMENRKVGQVGHIKKAMNHWANNQTKE